MNEMFKQKQKISKIYWALVKKCPEHEQGQLHNFLFRDSKKNKSFVCEQGKDGAKEAVLNYSVIARSDSYCLVEIELLTGRHHQIRAQLAHIGCPIKGDLKYGFARSNPDAGISLHARKIEFTHPVSKNSIEITAPVPDNKLWKFFEDSVHIK
jgi:23S rRNA pseudouridine1911/1915/1917 synthase